MSRKFYPILILALFTLSSCKEDEATKQKIVELEEKVANLESEKVGLEADVIQMKARDVGMNSGDAKALIERRDALEIEVRRLLPFETKVNELIKQNEDLAKKLAAATMTSSTTASTVSGSVTAGEGISKAVEESFVSIEGDHHTSGGFLVAEEGKVYLYTAASALAGNQKLTIRTSGGQALTKFGALELSEGVDVARMQVMDSVTHQLEMAPSDAVISEHMPVLALGMAKDSRVVAPEKSSINKAAGTAYELDNSFITTSIGGPVIHALSGKVLGVIGKKTTAPLLWPNESYEEVTEKVVARLNQKMEWSELKIGTFLGETKRLLEFDDATRLVMAVSSISVGGSTPQLEGMVAGSTQNVRQVLTKYQDKPLAQTFLQWKGDDPNKRIATSEADIKKKWRGAMGDAASLAQRGVAEMKVSQLSWYHRPWAEASLKARADVLENINEAVEGIK